MWLCFVIDFIAIIDFYCYNLDWVSNFNIFIFTASILLSIEKCQVSRFGIEWQNELISSASAGQSHAACLLCQDQIVLLMYSCVLQEKHQITRRHKADHAFCVLLKQIWKKNRSETAIKITVAVLALISNFSQWYPEFSFESLMLFIFMYKHIPEWQSTSLNLWAHFQQQQQFRAWTKSPFSSCRAANRHSRERQVNTVERLNWTALIL